MNTHFTQVQTKNITFNNLNEEWEKFSKNLQMQQIETGIEGNYGLQTPKQTQHVINLETKIRVTTTQDIEIIPT